MSYVDVALPLVKGFEGYRAYAYRDAVGVWTRYYGETKPSVVWGPQLSEPQAASLLRDRLVEFGRGVEHEVKVRLNASQAAALTSFAYNVGLGAFRSSTLLRRLNAGHYDEVPAELMKWVKGGGRVLPGLVARRKAEARLWGVELDPLRALTTKERRMADRLLYHRREMRRLRRGPQYDANRQHAEDWKRSVESQMRALRRDADKSGWAKDHRGSRYQALKLVLADRDGRV